MANFPKTRYPESCPQCKQSLLGKPIPENQQESFGATHFSRVIGLSNRDSVYAWKCPDCQHEWDRDLKAEPSSAGLFRSMPVR